MEEIKDFEKFYELFQGLDQAERIQIWNEYQDDVQGESQIYNMDDLDMFLEGREPSEIIRLAFYGYDANAYRKTHQECEQFNPNRPYFYFNGYGNLVSLEEVEIFEDRLTTERATFDKANASDLFRQYNWYTNERGDILRHE